MSIDLLNVMKLLQLAAILLLSWRFATDDMQKMRHSAARKAGSSTRVGNHMWKIMDMYGARSRRACDMVS